MIFKRELAEKVMRGEKTVTRRLCSNNPRSPWWRERCAYREGQVFTINPGRGVPRIGEARVTGVRKQRLGDGFCDEEARREGFPTTAAFVDAFVAINGSIDPAAVVWRVEFEVVS
ncbi:MAG: ASCH domain-containing protein [Solirubrobacteraceae bacterium]